ncbi:SHOCT domain-containing protein [Nocardia sp. NBC_01503]|uniref:SHOCT domain-containing protein n=1 Tax=Nocardia sp. NBC_01503 TaxID=2975997 RepID=UPI002E7B81A9|nr:SHOCT domain-containing protein [Nocardia sp. NBC_01503]WTL30016.1 SHOCT domain-containing protein [Nocardia sp. NBC_01503]
MMWNDGYGWGWGGWVLMGGMMVLFWGLVLVVGFAAVHYLRTANSGRSESVGGSGVERAEVVLAERLARGAIDEDQYRKLLAVLRETRS